MAVSIGTFIITDILGGAVLVAGEGAAFEGGYAALTASFLVGPGVASAVGSAAIIGGLVGLNAVIGRTPQSNPQYAAQAGFLTLRQAVAPRSVTLGRNRVAGVYMLYESVNGKSYDVITLDHGGPIGGFVKYYFHDDEVFLSVAGDGTLDQAALAAAYPDGRYQTAGFCHLYTRTGAVPETAYSAIVSDIPTIWTNAHRGDGQASMALVISNPNADVLLMLWPHGHPEPSAVIDGTPVFDPRDPTQSLGNPSTWKVSYNPVINFLFYMTDEDRGLGMDWNAAVAPVLTSLMAEASLCDEQIQKKDLDYENRYACGGTYNLDNDPADVIAPLLAACDGWMTLGNDGTIALKAGKYRVPTVTFKDKHVIGCSVQRLIADKDVVNQYELSFTSPTNKYKKSPGDPWKNQSDINTRGKVRPATLDMPWVQSHSQLRRLAKRAMARQQAPLRGTLTTTLYGLVARGERWINLQLSTRRGLENAVVEISKAEFDLVGRFCTFEWVIVDPSTIDAWDAASEEGTEPPVPDDASGIALPVPQNLQGISNGDPPFRIDVSWDDPGRNDLTYRVRFRLVDDGTGSPGPWSQQDFSDATISAGRVTVTVFPTTADFYEVQVASRAFGSMSAWSDPIFVTTSGGAMYDDLKFVITDNASPGEFITDDLGA